MSEHSTFSRYIHRSRERGQVVVQPRMGWGSPEVMRQALLAVKQNSPPCIGTLTLDSYTRIGDYLTPLVSLRKGHQLNGYPIVSHSAETTRAMLAGVQDEDFPIQVRHGTPKPQLIFRRMIELALDATEGGPVSYCLPYSRISLSVAIGAWEESCRLLAGEMEHAHVESFGGCLMGQLCPPSMLVTMSVLECCFFKECGLRSVSLSYAQGTSYTQDRAALALLRELAAELLGGIDWHVVLYTYMGLFPATEAGAATLIAQSARLARESATERLIVKTKAESRSIPTLEDNLQALRLSRVAADAVTGVVPLSAAERGCYEEIKFEVMALLDAVLSADCNVSRALSIAFRRGLLDVPYCLHPDNRSLVRSAIDDEGRLVWANTGNLPIRATAHPQPRGVSPSQALLTQLSYLARRCDQMHDPSQSTHYGSLHS